ncbi:MAG: hypothetical protein KGJ92_03240 [Actinomycetales bacterium]|nr:hypothetical protein [Actinomycetales bacterium]
MIPVGVDQWLAERTPPVAVALGVTFARGGVDGEDLGWVEGAFVPEAVSGGPGGVVSAGVLAVALGAAMVLAVDVVAMGSGPASTITALTLEIDRDPRCDETLVVRGEVEGLTRVGGSARASVSDASGAAIARAAATLARA